MHFESWREAGGFGCGMVLSPWSYLAKLLPWLKLMFLLSVSKSLTFLRTHSERQGFRMIGIRRESHHNGEVSSLRADMKHGAWEARGVHRAGPFGGNHSRRAAGG